MDLILGIRGLQWERVAGCGDWWCFDGVGGQGVGWCPFVEWCGFGQFIFTVGKCMGGYEFGQSWLGVSLLGRMNRVV